MDWIKNYDLFLFDFDGLLVNTEELHYLAYKEMCRARGVHFTWTFARYCASAHYATSTFRNDLFKDFPELAAQDPSWTYLYPEKQAAMQELLKQGAVQLMPGVESLLTSVQKHRIPHSVVTHSPDELVNIIRNQHAILNQIPHWVTRRDYTNPKPDPECYQLAIQRYGKEGGKVIGFEDTPRGLSALLGSDAEAVLITKIPYVELPDFIQKGVRHYQSFVEIS
jgi:beta-phosphoglucomutase